MLNALSGAGVGWSITVPGWANVRRAIAQIADDAWTSIDYPSGGAAQVAGTVIWVTHRTRRTERLRVRLVVRRTRLTGAQATLWPDWRCHTSVTNLDQPVAETDQHHPTDTEDSRLPVVEADRYHRHHAVCELAIRDLKGSGGLAHLPSGKFCANAAWLLCAALAHNLYREVGLLAKTQTRGQVVYGSTVRRRLFGVPGRVVNHSGRWVLRLPARWRWKKTYLNTLRELRALPQLC